MIICTREYRPADWPAVCRVHDRARPIELASFAAPEKVQILAEADDVGVFHASRSWVAEVGGQVIGFVSIDAPQLTFLYVDPALHRRGIGWLLVKHVLPILGTDGYLYTATENALAVAFYRSCGFVVAARFPGEACGCGCECLRMVLPRRGDAKPAASTGHACDEVGRVCT